jgi:hypothetical protein
MDLRGSATVIVHRSSPAGHDAYGDPIDSASSSTVIGGCAIAPRAATESTERGREGVVIGVDVYMPACSDVRRGDEVEIPAGFPHAGRYEVDGDPAEWMSQTGSVRGVVAALRRAAG